MTMAAETARQVIHALLRRHGITDPATARRDILTRFSDQELRALSRAAVITSTAPASTDGRRWVAPRFAPPDWTRSQDRARALMRSDRRERGKDSERDAGDRTPQKMSFTERYEDYLRRLDQRAR